MTLLQANKLSLRYGQQAVLEQVNLSLKAGELIGLIGPNGAGKSSLLKLLAGLHKAQHGEIQLLDKPINHWSLAERSRLLAWVEQQGTIHWPLSVERLVALGRLPHLAAWQKPSELDRQAIEQALNATHVAHLRERSANTLSGGERTRVLLARALAGQPRILLADEPIATLDLAHQLQIMQLLRDIAQGDSGVIVVLHDLSLAVRYCDKLYLLENGRIAAQGAPQQVITKEWLSRVYGVECNIQWGDLPLITALRPVQNIS